MKEKYPKIDTENWEDSLTKQQKYSIERGLEDIKNGRVLSHEEAKKRIKNYIAEKTK